MGNKQNSFNPESNQTSEYVSQKTNKHSTEEFIIKWHRYQKQTNPAINNSIDNLLLFDQRRVVFISLIGLYQTWKYTPTPILYSSIFMLPLKQKWVKFPIKHEKYIRQSIIGQMTLFQDKNSFDEFMCLLKWKNSQCLAFWMLDEYTMSNDDNDGNMLIAPFWKHFSNELSNLYDPVTKSKYKPIKFDQKWWTQSYYEIVKSKYDVKPSQILNELYFVTMKYKSIQEILYQSNPDSLKPIKSYQCKQVVTNNNSDFCGFVACHNVNDDENEEQCENEGIWMISTDYDR